MGRLILIIGGARSGKSTYAQNLAQKLSNKVAFIATAEALDDEMAQRIRAHKNNRPLEWATIEAPYAVKDKFLDANIVVDTVILDCVTLLVSNLLMRVIENDQVDESRLNSSVYQEFEGIITNVKTNKATWIVVSNEVGSGIVPADPYSRIYRDTLGKVNQWLAAEADEVYNMVAGIAIPIHQYRS